MPLLRRLDLQEMELLPRPFPSYSFKAGGHSDRRPLWCFPRSLKLVIRGRRRFGEGDKTHKDTAAFGVFLLWGRSNVGQRCD